MLPGWRGCSQANEGDVRACNLLFLLAPTAVTHPGRTRVRLACSYFHPTAHPSIHALYLSQEASTTSDPVRLSVYVCVCTTYLCPHSITCRPFSLSESLVSSTTSTLCTASVRCVVELMCVHHHLIVAGPGLVNVLSKTILLVLITYNEVRGESFLKVVQWYVWTTGTCTEPMECYCSEAQFYCHSYTFKVMLA